MFGVVYLLYTTIPIVFGEIYGFDPSRSGLVYLSLGVGNVLDWLVIIFFSDRTVVRQPQANGGVFVPEMRLTIGIYFDVFLPIMFFSVRLEFALYYSLGFTSSGVGTERFWNYGVVFVYHRLLSRYPPRVRCLSHCSKRSVEDCCGCSPSFGGATDVQIPRDWMGERST